jgi:hypothetical protein
MDKAIENFVAALQMNSEYEKAKSWHAKVLQEQAVLRANANSAATTADTSTSSNTSKPTDGTTTSTTTAANSTNGTGDSSSAATAVSGTAISGNSSGTVSDDVIINTVPLTPETTNCLKKAHYDETDTAQA